MSVAMGEARRFTIYVLGHCSVADYVCCACSRYFNGRRKHSLLKAIKREKFGNVVQLYTYMGDKQLAGTKQSYFIYKEVPCEEVKSWNITSLQNYFIIFSGCSSTHVGSVNTIDRVGLHVYMICCSLLLLFSVLWLTE